MQMFSVFYFYLSANQSAVHKVCRMLCSESRAKQAHCYKEIKEDLRRLCNHLNVFVLNIISGLVAEICLQQAELLRTSTLHAIPADIFFLASANIKAALSVPAGLRQRWYWLSVCTCVFMCEGEIWTKPQPSAYLC